MLFCAVWLAGIDKHIHAPAVDIIIFVAGGNRTQILHSNAVQFFVERLLFHSFCWQE